MKKDEIKEIRKMARLSQRAMGEEIGVSRDQWANFEHGRTVPDLEMQKKIRDFQLKWEMAMPDLENDFPSLAILIISLRRKRYEAAAGAVRDLVKEIEKKRRESDTPLGNGHQPLLN